MDLDDLGFEVEQIFVVFGAEPWIAHNGRFLHGRSASTADSDFHI